ncbi:hypothetical protein SGCOL_004135 [Colletotrichum sp. CLE4]
MPTTDQVALQQQKPELPEDVKPPKAQPTADLALQQSSEAESQSKPPSEVVVPDGDKTTEDDSPRISDRPCKAIVINFLATPQKQTKTFIATEAHGESDSSEKAVLTPENSESKKAKKNKKKKKKPTSASQDESHPIGDTSTKAADDDTPHTSKAMQTGASDTADIISKAKDIAETEASSGKSSLPEPLSKNFRANAGGSLRLPKNRRKHPTQLSLAVREGSASGAANVLKEAHVFDGGLPSAASTSQMSFSTAQESRSGNSSPKVLSTPATPSSARTPESRVSPEMSAVESEATSKSTMQLNPKAKEFVSPAPRPVVHRVKLAPIPLVPIPVKNPQHQRNFSHSSSATSHTLTPGPTPPKDKVKGCQEVAIGDGVDKGQVSTTREAPTHDEGAQKPASENMGKMKKDHPADGHTFFSQTSNASSGNGHKQRPKKGASKKKQQHGKQEPEKSNTSPKKQDIRGQTHGQRLQNASGTHSRKLSVASRDDFPSLPPAPLPASGLPASSVWGKARATSTAVTNSNIPSTGNISREDKTKDKTSSDPLPGEDSGKH